MTRGAASGDQVGRFFKGYREAYVGRRLASVAVWGLVPALTLLASRSSTLEPLFRARPYNSSYDTMFVAATAGIAVASAFVLVATRRQGDDSDNSDRCIPVEASWRNALDVFELVACASLAVSNALVGVQAAAAAWFGSLAVLSMLSWRLQTAERGTGLTRVRRSATLSRVASVALVAFAGLLIGFPVLQSWSGPPEAFVRWHPFSVPAEFVWRSLFLSFAIGMLVAATDPLSRHRPFLLMLVASGYLHSFEMAVDNLAQVSIGGMNGNPQHLYGDVLGWFVIASFALSILLLDARGRPAAAGRCNREHR